MRDSEVGPEEALLSAEIPRGWMRLTRIGGPTVLIEFDGWRILSDPTFDPPGRRYGFGLGASSVKTAGPAVPREHLGRLDAVLVSHDHHADNLDDLGREMLVDTPVVLTTHAGRRRLGGENIIGLSAWENTTLARQDGARLEITATPCRHGPPFSRALVGDVIGFALRRPGEVRTALWVSGDTVKFRGTDQVAARLDIDVAIIHLGAVRFPATGRLTYSLDARRAMRVLERIDPRVALPVHYEGWSHFSEPESHMLEAVEASPARHLIQWLPLGEPTLVRARG